MQTLTRKEEQIMQAVWQIGHPCLISEILKKDVTLKRNTVAPGIITLTKKGYLKVDSIGKSMTSTGRAYAPLIDQHAYNEQKKLIQCVVDSPTTKGGIYRLLLPDQLCLLFCICNGIFRSAIFQYYNDCRQCKNHSYSRSYNRGMISRFQRICLTFLIV